MKLLLSSCGGSFNLSGASALSSYWTLLVVVTLTCLLLLLFRHVHAVPADSLRLPPGSHGWLPIAGETLEYARPNQSFSFMQRRAQRYGEMFRSHLFGDPIIISCDAKVNQFICQHEFKLFRGSYPRSFVAVLGEKSILALSKELHKKVRGALINSTLATTLRTKESLKDVSTAIRTTLEQWDGRVVCVQDEMARMAYLVAAKRLLGLKEQDPECQALQIYYSELIVGLISIPLNIPGMAYHRSMKARAKIAMIIDDMIAKREAAAAQAKADAGRGQQQDFLDALMKLEAEELSSDAPDHITREVTRDVVLSVLFAGHDTVSKAMTCAVKFLSENAQVVEILKEEQSRIRDGMKDGEDLTWEDYKSMTFSNNVVSEVLRLTNIAPGVFRDALEDVDINGLRIPKGSKVMAYFNLNHLDSNKFQDPFQFNPWRWEEKTLSEANFMPFGGGPRLCPGYEFAKLQICIFLHHLVLKYRYFGFLAKICLKRKEALIKGLKHSIIEKAILFGLPF